MSPRHVVTCLTPCRRGARRVPGQTHSSESVCPGCEGGSSVGEGFCHNLTTAPENSWWISNKLSSLKFFFLLRTSHRYLGYTTLIHIIRLIISNGLHTKSYFNWMLLQEETNVCYWQSKSGSINICEWWFLDFSEWLESQILPVGLC